MVVAVAAVIGFRSKLSTEGQTQSLGFQNVGYLTTQSVYSNEVKVVEGSRDLFGVEIPFTQSKYIYSYGVEIEAGLDFTQVTYEVNDETEQIVVKLPPVEVKDSHIDTDSFKVYYEKESIFRRITLEEDNEARREMEENAKESAVANGLLEKARSNAETVLRGFFASAYDLDVYELIFEDL